MRPFCRLSLAASRTPFFRPRFISVSTRFRSNFCSDPLFFFPRGTLPLLFPVPPTGEKNRFRGCIMPSHPCAICVARCSIRGTWQNMERELFSSPLFFFFTKSLPSNKKPVSTLRSLPVAIRLPIFLRRKLLAIRSFPPRLDLLHLWRYLLFIRVAGYRGANSISRLIH